MTSINLGPHDVGPEAHDKYAFFWEIQNRKGVPGFHSDRHDWALFASDFTRAVQAHTKRDRVIYVRAYDFGKYPEVYRAMEANGARVISLKEAEELILAGEAVSGLNDANG